MQQRNKIRLMFVSTVLGATPAVVQAEVETKLIGDLRGGYYAFRTENRDGSITRDNDARFRIRAGVHAAFSDSWSANVRFAGHYSDEQQQTRFSLHDYNDSRQFGESTLDMANAVYRPNQQWSVTLGRMQTKFELLGVAKKSLDRNDSPNVDIDFTDGVHAVRNSDSGWKTHMILQHNPEEGSTNVTRGPLNFVDSGTRVTAFLGVENKKPKGAFVQRGVDITLIPDALLVNGSTSGPRDDYIGIVGRVALQWPLGGSGTRFLWGGELGYAPNVPQKSALKIGGTEDVNDTAWQTSFNLMDFKPRHSIGLVLGKAGGGWLISPDFRENERLMEIRYKWVINKKLSMESRVRNRKESEQQTNALQKRDSDDLYVRLTYKLK